MRGPGSGSDRRLPKDVLEWPKNRAGRLCRDIPKDDSSVYGALHRLVDRAGVPAANSATVRRPA